jgi:hypothetical protein
MQKAPVDLTGDWTVHTGALVTITQNGNRISMRVQGIYLLNGTVEESSDPDFLARVNVSDGTTTGRYLLTRDGRLTGSVDDGFLSAESVLTRR